ncbi:MAG: hypothetical protein WA996_21760 [Candidatus Promineifilaceae bacterium]
MNHSETQSLEYWVSDLVITDADVEQIYNHFLEAERPQVAGQISDVIVNYRVSEERNRIKQLLSGRTLYQPMAAYNVGDELVFPALRFAAGTVQSVREGYDPSYGKYDVVAVEIDARTREFASNLAGEHKLNIENGDGYDPFENVDLDDIKARYGASVTKVVVDALSDRDEFVLVEGKWFVKDLMADVNIGHLHLAEAVLDMNEGGPLPSEEIIVHLDLDEGLDNEVRLFSLNYALSEDNRFDEVGPPGKIDWFLRKAEPDAVHIVPERLRYTPLTFDRAQLSPQLLLLERELDDEWSDLDLPQSAQPTILALTYPHRRAGTLPLSSRNRPLFPIGSSLRQRVVLIDEQTEEEIEAWVVREGRYIFGLGEWYSKHSIPVGGFITLKPGPESDRVLIDFDRRRPKREWVRLATVEDNQLKFELERRSVGCGYDDLLIVGTDFVGAIDSLARRMGANNKTLASIMLGIFPTLAKLTPQETVHTKTLYSAINMIRRVPPGPLFAELSKHPAFQPVGDHYWQYDASRPK